jgi:hypothetical protein
MGKDRPGDPPGGGPILRVAVAFDPGLVRVGRLAARDGSSIDVEFSRRQRHTLAVGACVQVGIDHGDDHATPNQSATVTERSDRGGGRRYRLLLHGDTCDVHRQNIADHPATKLQPIPVELRFGQFNLAAVLTNWTAQGTRLRVTRAVEAKLCSTDALELVFRPSDTYPEVRLIGWIERRLLDDDHVNYDFRIDEHLSDDGATQRARLRSFVAGALKAEELAAGGESATDQAGP